MKVVINCNIVQKDHIIGDGVIVIDNGKIISFGKKKDIKIPDGAEIIDAEGNFVGPGLVEIHTHAADNIWLHEDPETASKELLKHGVTSVLPALYYSLTKDMYLKAIDTIFTAVKEGRFKNYAGLYMEGPYLNPNYGCDREHNTWKGVVDRKDYIEILEKVKNDVKVWCISPERENIEQFVKEVKQTIPDITFSVAHSEAIPEQIERFIPYGLRIATHHTNATGTVYKYSECRGVCVDETVNYNDDIYAEIISDRLGIHVDPYMQRLVRKIKGDDRMILIADQFVSDGPIPEGYEEATDIHFDFAGEIAGSGLTLDIACRNYMFHTGCSICDVFKAASTNPAKAAGIPNVGKIAVGYDANLVVTDGFMNIKKTILKGEIYE